MSVYLCVVMPGWRRLTPQLVLLVIVYWVVLVLIRSGYDPATATAITVASGLGAAEVGHRLLGSPRLVTGRAESRPWTRGWSSLPTS